MQEAADWTPAVHLSDDVHLSDVHLADVMMSDDVMKIVVGAEELLPKY